MQDQGEASPHRLEQLISDQNLLIERLRAELKSEKAYVEVAKRRCLYTAKVEDEVKRARALLKDNGITELSQKAFDKFKNKIEQDVSQAFSQTLHDVKSNHQKEIEKLKCCFKEDLDQLKKQNSSEDELVKGIKDLDDSLSHFRKTTESLGNVLDSTNQNEIELLTSSLGQLNISNLELSPVLANISRVLVQSVEREISIRNELLSFKTKFTMSEEECKKSVVGTPESSNIDESKFVQIEHSVNICNHDRDKDVICHDQPSSSKLENILGESSDQKQSPSTFSLEMETLLSYTNKLKKYIKDMVNFYNGRLNRLIKSESEFKCLSLSSVNVDEILSELESSLPQPGRLMTDIKECHRMIFCLNEILKSLDHNLDSTLKKNKHLDEELIKLKQSHTEKVFSLDSHIKLLNEKIVICLRENKSLESNLADLRSKTISKNQFDLLNEERNNLIATKKHLEDEVESLTELNVNLEKINKKLQDGIPVKAQQKIVSEDDTFSYPDCSINYENLLPLNVITSTPFHPKTADRSATSLNQEILKSSLIEWIERCQALESEKKQLERKLFNLNFSFHQANSSKKILEQEMDILKTNIKQLENKVADYVTLKEKCHILENDNTVLNIKNKFMTELQNSSKKEYMGDYVPDDISQFENKYYTSFDPDSFDSSFNAFNFINEFQKKNQKIIFLESKCRSKDSVISELSIKLNQSKEMEKSMENKIEVLLFDNNKIYEKLFTLIDENAQMILDKKVSDIELKSAKDQLNYLISSGDMFKDNSSNELIEAMKNDALKFLKDSIDKWSKVELKSVEISPAQIDRLDARHQVEILIKNNNLLKNDKEDLLQKLEKLQHEFHKLQRDGYVDEGWYIQIDKYEKELVQELKDQREQHARIEEALRSTGNLHDELQKQLNLHRVKLQEISSLQKKLEEEKNKNKCSEAQVVLLENELKEKEKMLMETIDAKKANEARITSLEKEFAQKEKTYQSDLIRAKWISQFSQNKSIGSQVKKELTNFQHEVYREEKEKEKRRCASMDAIYQHSLDSLRYCLEYDKAEALARTSENHQTKMKEYVGVLKDLISRIEELESCKIFKSLGIDIDSQNQCKLSQIQENKEKLYKELLELESNEVTSSDDKLISLFKSKLHEYYNQQFYLSISYLKEELKSQNEIKFKALNELHQEEMTLLKLRMDADKNTELHVLSQDQLKREKNLINSLTQNDINPQSSMFHNFKVSVIRMFLRYIQMFIPSWEKKFNKDLEELEKKYQVYLDSYKDTTLDNAEAEISEKIENIISNQSLIVDNSQNFLAMLEEYLSSILKSAEDFIKEATNELNSTVALLKSKDYPKNITALHEQIKMLQIEKDELNEKHKAAVQLLVSDHKEELLKIRSLVDGINKSNPLLQDNVLDELRSELEAKHVREVDDLRKYFEQKFAEFEKNYSEEILSHHSCKMSIGSTSSEAELVSEINSIETPFVATWIVTGDPIGGNPEGYDLVSELYSDKDVEKGLLVERYFVDFNAMDKVLLKHKYIVDKMDSDWRERMRALYSDLEKNYSERLQIEMQKLIKNEEKVNEILKDVKKECVKELEWINTVRNAAVFEKSIKSDLERHYENEMSKMEDEFENRLVKETEHLMQMHKMRELEAVWAAQVEAEQSYKQEIQTIKTEWEKKYVSEMASFIAERSIRKVQFEEDVKSMIHAFNSIFSKHHQIAEEKLKLQVSKLDDLQEKVAELSDNQTELCKVKDLCNVEKEVMQKNCNNIVNQTKIDAKHSQDLLISMYEKELEQLAETHKEEMKVVLEKHKKEVAQLKENVMDSSVPSEDQIMKRARDLAINEIIEYIKNFVLKEDENEKGGNLITLPPEFVSLEKFFKNRFNKILDEQALKHSEDLDNLRQHFLSKFDNLTKVSDEDRDSDSTRSICQTCGPDASQEVEKLVKERDALRKLADSLKSAVNQLTSYLHTCEDEVNKNVLEQLIRAATSNENSPVRQGGSNRRVHFAPDVSKILDTSTLNETTYCDISLNDPDVSTKLKQELDSCLSKLKKEAANIFGLSVASRTTQRFISLETTLSDMARHLLSDKVPPSAEIMNVIEELTMEGDRLIEQLHQEKDDLQQQITAADNQLKSTRAFLEDQAFEREAERDEYSRELSLLQAHIKQATPDTRHQTLSMQVEDLEKQVKETTSSLESAETRKKELEAELKNTVEKVWVLTDIINKLESQLNVKSEREECLEKRLDELEAELEHQSIAQHAMVQEMESLKSKEESEGNYMEQIAALQEEMKLQYSSNSIRNIKAQLREIEKGIENRTKELEGLNLTSSTTSLSSPSEEISIREHLEMMRSHTPEFCPSPVALPIDEVNKLQDKIHRHIRSEDMIIKKVKDQDLHIKKISHVLGEVQAEREVLQQTVDKLNVQLGRANTKVDDLRRKAETAHSSANQALSEKISHLEQQVAHLKQSLEQAQSQLQQKEEQINRAKDLIDDQNVKLRNYSQANPEIVQALQLELASVMTEKNKLEELVLKYKNEAEALDMSPLYNCLLNDKNEDIQQLQRTVSILQSQQAAHSERSGVGDYSASVVGKTVSFADELSPIGRDISPCRDAPKNLSYSFQPFEMDKAVSMGVTSEIHPQASEPTISSSTSTFNVNNSQFIRNESSAGDEKITKLESEVKNLRSLVADLTDAKKDVESYISSFTDDRKYYESQLNKLLDEKKSQEDEIEKLRLTLEKKDNEIKNTTADVTKLQVILSNLQEKLKQASKFATKDNELKKELSEMKDKCSMLEEVLKGFYKFRDELGSINEDFKYRENTDDYFQNILGTLKQKLMKSTDIELSNSNLKRQNDDLKNEIFKLKQENNNLSDEIICKKQEFIDELSIMKSEMDEINQNNAKLKNDIANYLRLKQDNIDMLSKIEQLELCKNLMEVELNSLKSENNKLVEELECIRTELKFKNINNNYDGVNEKEIEDASLPHEPEHVADLEDLTYEIEKQLDLSAKLDNSLLNTIGDKSYYKKEPTVSAATAPPPLHSPMTHLKESAGGSRQTEASQPGLVSWLAKEVNAWQSAGSKQNQLASQLNNLSRVVQTQDNRITRLLVELDGKKKECLVMELDLLRERSNLKQVQCLLETERQRARSIQKEDTHLIETLRIRLEATLKAESSLKSMLLEEKQKNESLEACLNSARALESYIQSSSSDSETNQTVRNQLLLRIEVDRLKQINNDLEHVISRERNYQASLKDKLKLLQLQNQSSEKQAEELKQKLSQEMRLRESVENQMRSMGQNFTAPRLDNDIGSKLAMESVLTEIKQWKDECMQLRECIRLQREHEDYWTTNVQTPLIKQLNDVNRSLENLVREKITLQTYVNCIEKERDFLRSRVEKLEEMNEKLSGTHIPLSPQMSTKLNLQSVFNKLQYLAELNHKMESHRKALIWQKRYLLIAINGYQKTTAEAIDRISPLSSHSQPKKRVSFRGVVHVISACIKLNYIYRRRKASRKVMVNRMKAEINLPTTPLNLRKNTVDILGSNSNNNCMILSPPSRDLYAIPRLVESSGPSADSEPSKLSQYIAMFDQMQKRLGKIIQNENL